MPSKKREKEPEPTPKNDPIQADHELFLQAFEKPTQIYRFLRTRNILSPIFLNRTLTYMRQRMSRTHKARKNFHVDSLLERTLRRKSHIEPAGANGYVTLTFLGLYDKQIDRSFGPFIVETLLLKICHKKRKDVSSPTMQVVVGSTKVPVNPSDDQPPRKAPTVSVSTESFSQSNGHQVESYRLLLRVHYPSQIDIHKNDDWEPPMKKRREEEGQTKLFGSELVVYDKHSRCLLADGEYEVSLQEIIQPTIRGSPKKHSSWETVADFHTKMDTPFVSFGTSRILKFCLGWTNEASPGYVDRPTSVVAHTDGPDKENTTPTTNSASAAPKKTTPREEKLRIIYQFLYNSNSRQQTEAREDLHCPWCALDCITLYALLKHLKLGHMRFSFTYAPIPQGARIDVSINECFDGSYAGNPHDLVSQPPGFAFSRNGPVRRTSVTNVLVCRPKRTRPSLSEFLEIEDPDFDGQRPYVTGHNRLYHHTTTCLPILPKDLDVDSEGENDPEWLRTKTMMMIDDFTDVNEGEKELMKMWNLHVMKHGFVGDCQIPLACTMFVESHGREVLRRNLYRNFMLHLSNLYDFGLLSPVSIYKAVQQMQAIMSEPTSRAHVRASFAEQRSCWKGDAS